MKGVIIQQTDIFELELTIRKILKEELASLNIPHPIPIPTQDSIDEPLISKTEAAKIIGVSTLTLNKMIKDKAVRMYIVGKRQKFKKSQLVQSLEYIPKR